MTLHLIKLAVGVDSAATLEQFVAERSERRRAVGERPCTVHVTRQMPRRGSEVLDGGSLYWVIKGVIQARQKVLAVEAFTDVDGVPRCSLVLDPAVVRTEGRHRKAFQGWRYLRADEAPADRTAGDRETEELPAHVLRDLGDLGLL